MFLFFAGSHDSLSDGQICEAVQLCWLNSCEGLLRWGECVEGRGEGCACVCACFEWGVWKRPVEKGRCLFVCVSVLTFTDKEIVMGV